MQKDLPEKVIDAVREKAAGGLDYENPPQLSEEEKARNAKLQILRKTIIDRANEYVATPVSDRPAKKYLLAEIQQIVDEVDDAFVLVVPQKDGTPYSITFNPRTPEPEDPGIPAAASQSEKTS